MRKLSIQSEEASSDLELGSDQNFHPSKAYSSYFEILETIFIALVITVAIFWFVGRAAVVSGHSMLPTMQDGNLVVVRSAFYEPQVGDVVIVRRTDKPTEPLIKRVVAKAGQTIDINFDSGMLYVDGIVLEESYINSPTNLYYDVVFPQTVPQGCLFVLGDNRNASQDSRSSTIGMVDIRNISGKVEYRFFPWQSRGAVTQPR